MRPRRAATPGACGGAAAGVRRPGSGSRSRGAGTDPGERSATGDRTATGDRAPRGQRIRTGDPDRETEVLGNTATQTELIRRTLPLSVGDVLHASDKRLREARFKVLALGYFRDVTLAMRKGSARGQVIIEVRVVERGTVVLNRLWFGTSNISPYWLGADVGERNLLGLGIGVGIGFIFAAHGDVEGSRNQWATELRASDPSLLGSRWGANSSFTLVHGSEVYRVGGDPQDVEAKDLRRLLVPPVRGTRGRDVRRHGALAVLRRGPRGVDRGRAPHRPTRQLPDGRTTAIDLTSSQATAAWSPRGSASIATPGRIDPAARGRPHHRQRGARLVLLGGSYEVRGAVQSLLSTTGRCSAES
ncbi:MAG: hypothetical protein IPQ07_12770 [Myxococcales bacterium]|nr:hypothetical protein [Myxococcales bacterium]